MNLLRHSYKLVYFSTGDVFLYFVLNGFRKGFLFRDNRKAKNDPTEEALVLAQVYAFNVHLN